MVPDGTEANPQCSDSSYVFAVNRYDVDTAKFSLIYAATRANFPAPDKGAAYSWKLAFDESKQRLYWWYSAGSCAGAPDATAVALYCSILRVHFWDHCGGSSTLRNLPFWWTIAVCDCVKLG